MGVSRMPDPSLQIRRAKVTEARDIERVLKQAYEQYRGKIEPPLQALSARASQIVKEIRTPNRGYLVALLDGQLVGTLRYRKTRQDGRRVLCLSRLAVDPGARRRGIGRRLMQEAESLARQWGITELRGNVRAALSTLLDYYASMGYRALGRRSKPGYPRYLIVIGKRLDDHGK